MKDIKFLVLAVVTAANALFMFVSFATYNGAGNIEAMNAAFSACLAWGWLAFVCYQKHKESK